MFIPVGEKVIVPSVTVVFLKLVKAVETGSLGPVPFFNSKIALDDALSAGILIYGLILLIVGQSIICLLLLDPVWQLPFSGSVCLPATV